MEIDTLQVGPIGTNCYLLCDPAAGACAVIDPGGDADRVIRAVEARRCVPRAILLTHGHYDHTGAAAALRERWPEVPVYLSRRDQYPGDPVLSQLFPPVPGAADYGEGDTVAVGALTVEVLATPGHSEGGVTLRCGDALFCGDTLFAGSCGRTDFPGGSMPTLLSSLRRLGALEGNLRVLPGHMEPSTLDAERRTNPYLRQAMEAE
ncbi:MBL fold metallo-hydrolase [uncultured Oscillibacter sp.]|uniref:MBL fold metallo-hydrolase n=1 Tax=uncultured Oscillibacter sp. TaxID=876091 RepID=UPI0025FAC250|nr:MBL fold metallo-hydrolase [uncultured Oscillibacter sp.]